MYVSVTSFVSKTILCRGPLQLECCDFLYVPSVTLSGHKLTLRQKECTEGIKSHHLNGTIFF